MEQVLLVVQVLIALALIIMVLIQRSDSDGFGLGSGGGGGGNLLSGRATANLLTRTTAILATLFIVNSLALAVLAANRYTPSIVDTIEEQQTDEKAAVPAVPLVGTDKDKVKDTKKNAKEIPSMPTGDRVTKNADGVAIDPTEQPVKPVKKPRVKPVGETTEIDPNNAEATDQE